MPRLCATGILLALCAACTTTPITRGASSGGQTEGGAAGPGGASANGGTSAGNTSAGGGATTTGGTSGSGGILAAGGTGAGGTAGTGGTVGSTAGAGGSSGASGRGGAAGGAGAARDAAPAAGGTNGSGGAGARDAADSSPDVSIDDASGAGGAKGTDLVATDGAQDPCPAGWRLVWSDEFDGAAGTAPDATRWVLESGNGSGGWGNNELEYYRTGNANAALDGSGNLVITAKQEAYGGFNYTSARLKTQGKASWMYGHIEARIKIPYGQGIWPAFWMLGDDISTVSWPKCGEVDIMENIGSEPSVNHGSLHMPAAGTSNDNQLTGSYTLTSGKLGDDFHVYAIEWSASSIQFFFDGALYETQSPATATGRDWAFDQTFFILLNVAVGGNWPGSPNSSTVFPQTMTVDYVRVCQR